MCVWLYKLCVWLHKLCAWLYKLCVWLYRLCVCDDVSYVYGYISYAHDTAKVFAQTMTICRQLLATIIRLRQCC